MGAAWLLVRSDLRHRAPVVIALTLLVALAGTFVLTAATGALRPDRASERFLDSTAMWDGSIEVDYPDFDDVLADIEAQPNVAAASALAPILMGGDDLDGGIVAGLAPGWLDEVYRPRIVEGRLPDSERVDELLVSESVAASQDLAVGDEVVVEDFFGLGLKQRMTIVGIHRGVLDVALGNNYPGALATSAFGQRYGGPMYDAFADTLVVAGTRPEVIVRMRAGDDPPRDVLDAVARRHPAARPEVVDRSFYVAPIERALAVQVEAFWILTVAAGLSALLLLGMAMARFSATGTHDHQTLRAVGLGASTSRWIALAPVALVVVAGTVLALVGAAMASPLVPLGIASLVEPEPGIWIAPQALLIGGATFATGLALVSAVLIRLDRLPAGRAPRAARPSRRLPLPVRLGDDLAFRDGGWGRLALAATGIGLGLVVAVGVYTASVDDLMATPSQFGSDYDVAVYPVDGSSFDDFDAHQPGVEAAAISTGAQVTSGGDLLDAQVIDPLRGTAGGTVLRGRAPLADDEVALGPRTADRLGVGVGDDLTISGTEEHSMQVVGEALLPLLGKPAHGDVMWLTPEGAAELGVEPQEPRLLLKLTEGLSDARLALITGDHFPEDLLVPDDVSNLDGVAQIPLALASFGAVLAGAVLILAVVGIVRRRRRDLAILRALGCTPRYLRGAVLAAGIFIVVPGVAVALVVGAILGRAYWSAVADGVPAVASPVIPVAATALTVVAALAIGCVLVAGSARLATSNRGQDVLDRD